MKVIATIEGRLSSKRLHKKLLYNLGGKTIIEFLIDRLKKSKLIDLIVIATTKKKIDEKLIKIAKRNKVKFYTGSENNVLRRVYEAAKKYDGDAIVQVSGDSPLTDPDIIDTWIKIFKKEKPQIICEQWNKLPKGITAPVIDIKALEKSLKFSKNTKDLEHVTKFIFSNPKMFDIKFYKSKKKQEYPELNLCVDEINDYNLVNLLVEMNLNKKLNLLSIIKFFKNKKNLLKINKKVLRKSQVEHNRYLKKNENCN